MSTAAELLDALRSLDVEQTARKAISDNAEHYVLLNQGQMFEGKGKDRNIGTYRNFRMKDGRQYRDFKAAKNPLPGVGNVDLKLTGAFYRGMKMEVRGDSIEMDSTDSKAPGLLEKYGGQIYGLNAKNQPTFNEVAFLTTFQEEITRQTGLKFS